MAIISTATLDKFKWQIDPSVLQAMQEMEARKDRQKSVAGELAELRGEVDRLRKVLVLLLEGHPEVKMAVDVLIGGIGEVPR